MLEFNKEYPVKNNIKSILNFILESIKTCIMCFIAFFLGVLHFGLGPSDNSGEITIFQQQLEAVQADISNAEKEKASLESNINELKENNNKLESEYKELNSKLEELKNTKIQ